MAYYCNVERSVRLLLLSSSSLRRTHPNSTTLLPFSPSIPLSLSLRLKQEQQNCIHTGIYDFSLKWKFGLAKDLQRGLANDMRVVSGRTTVRMCSGMTDGETTLKNVIILKFPDATAVKVTDISGGCGAMYEVFIEAPDFNGKKLVQQHMMVNKALSSEIKDMHGIRITTKPTPSKDSSV